MLWVFTVKEISHQTVVFDFLVSLEHPNISYELSVLALNHLLSYIPCGKSDFSYST